MADKKKKGINGFVNDVIHGSDQYKKFQSEMADFKAGVEKRKAVAAKAPVDAPGQGVYAVDTLLDKVTIILDSDETPEEIYQAVQDTLHKVLFEIQNMPANATVGVRKIRSATAKNTDNCK